MSGSWALQGWRCVAAHLPPSGDGESACLQNAPLSSLVCAGEIPTLAPWHAPRRRLMPPLVPPMYPHPPRRLDPTLTT